MAVSVLFLGCTPTSGIGLGLDSPLDLDGDGLTDVEEAVLGTWPHISDSDRDGLNDGFEVELRTDPLEADTEGDGLVDGEEVDRGTDPLVSDTDRDGLVDGDEVERGTDPLDPDTDRDWLADGEELTLGTDPLVSDTDGDSYLDGDEALEGTDPNDFGDRIYVGQWPYNREKGRLDASPLDSTTRIPVGAPFVRFKGFDQHGDSFDLFDFANQGRYVVVGHAGAWCGPCFVVGRWLIGEEDAFGMNEIAPTLRGAIDQGEIYWVSVVARNGDFNPASLQDLVEWDSDYGHPKVPVVGDPGELTTWAISRSETGNFFPRFLVLDETMTIISGGDITQTTEFLNELLSPKGL